MTHQRKQKTWLMTLVVVLAMTLPGVAVAQDSEEKGTGEATEETESPAELESVLATLPVLGSGLDVTITRDDRGKIVSLGLDPSDGVTQIKEGDHRVVFLLGDDGPRVMVKSAGGVVQTKVKADDPAEATGPGSWSGDVFGTGTITIPYTVAFDGVTPTITVGEISAPADVAAEVSEPKTKTSDDGDWSVHFIKVFLESGENGAVLKLYAKTKVDDDGETRVSVSATLLSKGRADWWFDRDRHEDRDWDGRDRDDDKDRRGDRDWHDHDDQNKEEWSDRSDDRDDDHNKDEWSDRSDDRDWHDRDDDHNKGERGDRSEDRDKDHEDRRGDDS